MKRSRLILAAAGVLLGSSLVVHTLIDANGSLQRQNLRAELTALRLSNTHAELETQRLRAHIEALRSRPEVQERVVRDELGFVRDQDVVVEVTPIP